MEVEEGARRLSEALYEDKLVVLIGSAASAISSDESGRQYKGLSTPAEFVAKMVKSKSYLNPSWDFTKTCDAIVAKESRAVLEQLLIAEYKRPEKFPSPPAHKILARLPFSVYLTSNYDEFIERELERVPRRASVVVTNKDVSRIRRDSIRVIKYHGCVSRPETLVATSADGQKFTKERSLVGKLISVDLASRNLVVIGHGLADHDLQKLLNSLLKYLQDYLPTIYVVREPSARSRKLEINADRVEYIFEDLTRFVSRLLHQYRKSAYARRGDAGVESVWMNSVFFAELRQASTLPSETQVLDAFLAHLLEELIERHEVQSVREDAEIAVEQALIDRPNYNALGTLWSQINTTLLAAAEDVGEAESIVRSIREEREAKKTYFRGTGRRIVEQNNRILVYSQSQRVIQVLQGATDTIQRTCDLIIGECRPKSPYPYEDAAAVCRELSDTNYSIIVCPDVVAFDLLANRQIDKIIMGTHSIYTDNSGKAYAFVNTCGSHSIATLAEKYKIPLIVIGEQIKIERVPREEANDRIFRNQENDLRATALSLVELSTKRGEITHTNIGYDLVFLSPVITIEVPDAMESHK